MLIRALIMTGATLGVSMCATHPADDETNAQATTGPDGLILRHAPTDSVESGSLPAPGDDDGGES